MRRKGRSDDLTRILVRLLSNPRQNWPLALALLVVVVFLWWSRDRPQTPTPTSGQPPVVVTEPGQPGEYLFCFWNVENLFDDRDDRRRSQDEPYDNWFAQDAAAREL